MPQIDGNEFRLAILLGLLPDAEKMVDADIDLGPIVMSVYTATLAYLVAKGACFRDCAETIHKPLSC